MSKLLIKSSNAWTVGCLVQRPPFVEFLYLYMASCWRSILVCMKECSGHQRGSYIKIISLFFPLDLIKYILKNVTARLLLLDYNTLVIQ